MPPTIVLRGRRGLVHGAVLWVLFYGPAPLAAQELALQRDYPGVGPFECPPPVPYAPPAPDDQAQAGQLASDAIQAVILGELMRAQELLARATELDPSSAELAYRRARVFEDLSIPEDAMFEYCRAITLGARDSGILDTQQRLDAQYELVRDRIPPGARVAFADGVTLADTGLYPQSVDAFTTAIEASPDWAAAIYNRAVVLDAMGLLTESLADYRRYLEVAPTTIDPTVARVTERIGALEGMVALPTPSPSTALALGAVFPGMGQYYSRRDLAGTIVLASAAAAAATGILYKEVTIVCANPVPDCPPGQVQGETTERPYLVPAIGVAVAVTLAAAIEAYVRARGRRAEAAEALPDVQSARASARPRITGPSLTARRGRAELNLVGVSFR